MIGHHEVGESGRHQSMTDNWCGWRCRCRCFVTLAGAGRGRGSRAVVSRLRFSRKAYLCRCGKVWRSPVGGATRQVVSGGVAEPLRWL